MVLYWYMAMPEEIRPAAFEALIVEATDSFCVANRKLNVHLPVLLWKYMKWRYAEPGSPEPSLAYKSMICEARADCIGLGETTTEETEE